MVTREAIPGFESGQRVRITYTSAQSGNRVEREGTVLGPYGEHFLAIEADNGGQLNVWYSGKVESEAGGGKFGKKVLADDGDVEVLD